MPHRTARGHGRLFANVGPVHAAEVGHPETGLGLAKVAHHIFELYCMQNSTRTSPVPKREALPTTRFKPKYHSASGYPS